MLTHPGAGRTVRAMGGAGRSTSAVALEDVRRRLRPFLERKRVLKAIVFGSWARGTNTRRSDLDLAIVMETARPFLERRQDLEGIDEALSGLRPEIMIYAPGELEAIAHRPFIRSLLSEGVTLYER